MKGRGLRALASGRGLVLLGALAGAALLTWPSASAAESEVDQIEALLASPVSFNQRLTSLERLREIDSTDSRTLLEALAESEDEQLAVLSLATLGRCGHAGAKTTIESVLEDEDRSFLTRGAAMAAWCHKEKGRGKSWTDVRSYVDARASGNAKLDAMADALAAKLWEEGSNE